eukprot:3785769-Rhodomonas_salina.1
MVQVLALGASRLPEAAGSTGRYGIAIYTSTLRVSSSACEKTDWASETSVLCGLASGRTLLFQVVSHTMGARTQSLSTAFTYDHPEVSSSPANGIPDSGYSLSISGGGFGVSAWCTKARVGGSDSEGTDWISDTVVQARVLAGFVSSSSVVVTTGDGAGSLSEAL